MPRVSVGGLSGRRTGPALSPPRRESEQRPALHLTGRAQRCLDCLRNRHSAARRQTLGLSVRDLLPLPSSYAPFVFLCQGSLTYDALAPADNILFKQIGRLKKATYNHLVG